MNDHQREMMNDSGFIQETVFDGGKQSPTSVYSSWKDYDSGNPMGSYGGSGGSQWGNIFKALDASNSWKKGKQQQGSGYRGPWSQSGGGGYGGGGTKIGSGATLWQPPGPGGYQILHSGQQQQSGGGGGGIGGAISGAASGFLATGNPVGAAVGAIGGLFCDERLKVDIAPLASTEVNDALAEVAFFVKGLRECA